MLPDSPLSLIEFTSRIGNTIHTSPHLRDVWIVAELSDPAIRGGHFYTDLIQKDDAGKTVARLRANIWANKFGLLRQRFFAERDEDLRAGIKVKIRGDATHHNQYGLSFNITDIDPSYIDEGDLLRRRMEILKRLADEGVADNNRQIPLCQDAQRVAIISAEGAAGLGDFINQLEGNPGNYRFTYKIFNSPMQGEKAARGVVDALARINEEAELWDCVVIIRGGGATTDMNCFDDYSLALHLCCFELPVIVGIGHERDNCVLDYVAHTRCKTPTAVAEFLINHQREAWQNACRLLSLISREASLRLDGEKRRIAQIETFVPSLVRQIIDKESLRIKNFTASIPMVSGTLTTREMSRLEGLIRQVCQATDNSIVRAKERLRALYGMIEVLKPENTLSRGYSITRINGKALKSAETLPVGTRIETQLASGSVSSTVI